MEASKSVAMQCHAMQIIGNIGLPTSCNRHLPELRLTTPALHHQSWIVRAELSSVSSSLGSVLGSWSRS